MGLEGPSIYIGSSLGDAVQRRLLRLFTMEESKVLLVAGAAAGVAAVFRAPATGVVFALEVPYTDDLARRALLPVLMASATSYLTYVALIDTKPLFRVLGTGSGFSISELGGALLVGLLCGLLARWLRDRRERGEGPEPRPDRRSGAPRRRRARRPRRAHGAPVRRAALAWAGLPRLRLARSARSLAAADRAPVRGAAVAVFAVLGGGGTGGLFIPLALQGALLGSFAARVVGDTTTLFPVVGLAAFLGAGYRTPLASVMFVAETTGQATFVVPALIAAAVSQLLMGSASVSRAQQTGRAGHLERTPAPSDLRRARHRGDDGAARRQRRRAGLDPRRRTPAAHRCPSSMPTAATSGWRASTPPAPCRARRGTTRSSPTSWMSMRPSARPTGCCGTPCRAMERSGSDVLAVVDHSAFVGVVRTDDVIRLEEILDDTGT